METIFGVVAGALVAFGMAFLQNWWADKRSREQRKHEAERHQTESRQATRDKEIARVLDFLDQLVMVMGQFIGIWMKAPSTALLDHAEAASGKAVASTPAAADQEKAKSALDAADAM